VNVVATLALAITVLVLVGGVAAASRRLLGVRFGAMRLLIAGLIALLVIGPIAQAFAHAVPRNSGATLPIWFLVLAVACALLVAMLFLVVAEALVPTGRFTPVSWARGLRARLRRTRRYLQILAIVVRHGLGPYLRGRRHPTEPGSRTRLARSLRRALDEGGLTFVKLGQVLSTRRDLLPPEFIEELGALRDQAAPIPWADVERLVEQEYHAPLGDLFAEFDHEPLAAASVAQVHTARLLSGAEVVVKVQRPGIRSVVERDLDIVSRLARTLQDKTRWGRAAGTVELANGFAQAVREELDFRIEARNMTAVAAAGADPRVTVPEPHQALCTARVLVMQRLHGVPLASAGPVIAARGLVAAEVARELLFCLLRQVMIGGVFHADPHPGNVLLLADNRLGLLDFGSVGRLDAGLREALQRLLIAVDRGDPAGMADALLEVVARPDEIDEERLERALGQFLAQHLSGGAAASARMFADLFRIVSDFGLAIPPEVAAVFRAFATLEGGLSEVVPGFDVMTEARGFAERYFKERLSLDALRHAAVDEVTKLLPMLRRLPRRVDRIVGAMERGRLSLNVRLLADERDRRHVTGLLHRTLMTFISGVAGIMAVLLLGIDKGPKVTATVGLYDLFAYFLLVIACVLALRVLALIFRDERT
jgi:ubiquinone biosynthesis protein